MLIEIQFFDSKFMIGNLAERQTFHPPVVVIDEQIFISLGSMRARQP